MVHSKETFERWSSKKRPATEHSRMEIQEARRTKEKSTLIRSHSDSADKMLRKGMKKTPINPNSSPSSLGREAAGQSTMHPGGEEGVRKSGLLLSTLQEEEGFGGNARRNVLVSSQMRNSADDDNGRSDSNDDGRKSRREFAGNGENCDDEAGFIKESKQSPQEGRNRSGNYKKRTSLQDRHHLGFDEKRGRGRHTSPKRSGSDSSGSVERHQRIRKERRTSKYTSQRRSKRSSSSDEENRFGTHKNRSSRYERQTSSRRKHDRREDIVDITKKRPVCIVDSDKSESVDAGHSHQRSPVRDDGMSRRHGNYDGNSEGSDRHVTSVLDAGNNQSEDFQRRRGGKFLDASCSSASQGPTEVEEQGIVSVKSESALRKERRDRQKSRERCVRRREKEGQKAYYMQVNCNGKPYGDGVTAWRADLNKLARSLDPSVMDVREQPPTDMSTLRRRLRQNFEYSHPVDPIHIRQLVGRAVTQWRNTLWKKMDAGESAPKGFNKDVWGRLEKTRACPSHAEKSERMKHANSCRITLGRTGPRGEEGIREMLRLKKGASPDFDDVFNEMQRDKGYGGLAGQRKKVKKESGAVSVHLRLEGVVEDLPHTEDIPVRQRTNLSLPTIETTTDDPVEDDYVRGLELRIAKLQAEVDGRSKGPSVESEKRDPRTCTDEEENTIRAAKVCVRDEGEHRLGKKVNGMDEGNSKVGEGSGHEGSEDPKPKQRSVVNDSRKKLRSHKG